MANELQPLSLLFQNRLFLIPDYQRGYAWLQQQLVDFWDDLVNLQADRYHYTGLLSLKPLKCKETVSWGEDLWLVENGYKPCHIVDGQQRITTFVILLNEIVGFVRGLNENKGKSDKEITLGYETVEEIVSKYICRKRPPNGVVTTYLFGYEVDNPSAEYMKYMSIASKIWRSTGMAPISHLKVLILLLKSKNESIGLTVSASDISGR